MGPAAAHLRGGLAYARLRIFAALLLACLAWISATGRPRPRPTEAFVFRDGGNATSALHGVDCLGLTRGVGLLTFASAPAASELVLSLHFVASGDGRYYLSTVHNPVLSASVRPREGLRGEYFERGSISAVRLSHRGGFCIGELHGFGSFGGRNEWEEVRGTVFWAPSGSKLAGKDTVQYRLSTNTSSSSSSSSGRGRHCGLFTPCGDAPPADPALAPTNSHAVIYSTTRVYGEECEQILREVRTRHPLRTLEKIHGEDPLLQLASLGRLCYKG